MGSISTTPKTVDASITPDIDVDMYRFTVAAGQVVDFDIDTTLNGPGGLGSYLRLFNAQGQQLAFNNDAAAPGESVVGFDAYLRYTFATAGTYYLGVSNANNTQYDPLTGNGDTAGGQYSIGDYQLIVQTAPVLPWTPTIRSLKHVRSGAISTTAKTVNASITPDVDVDMYRFTVTAGQVVDFDIDTPLNGPGGLGSYLRLFNAQGQQLAFNNNATAPGENELGFDAYLRYTFATAVPTTSASRIATTPNTIRSPEMEIPPAAATRSASYQLIVQALPIDPDDSLSEATMLGAISTTAKTVDASITPDIDVDMYRFTVAAGQVVDFDIDTALNGPGGLGSYLRLFNGRVSNWPSTTMRRRRRERRRIRRVPAIHLCHGGHLLHRRLEFQQHAVRLRSPAMGYSGGQYSIGDYQLIVQAAPADPGGHRRFAHRGLSWAPSRRRPRRSTRALLPTSTWTCIASRSPPARSSISISIPRSTVRAAWAPTSDCSMRRVRNWPSTTMRRRRARRDRI